MYLTNGVRKFMENVCWAKLNWLFLKLGWWEQHLQTAPWVMLQLAVYTVASQTCNVIFLSCKYGLTICPEPLSNENGDAWKLLVFSTHHIKGWHAKIARWLGSICVRVTVWLHLHPCGMQRAVCRCDEFAVMEERWGKSNQSSPSPAAAWTYNSLLFCDDLW